MTEFTAANALALVHAMSQDSHGITVTVSAPHSVLARILDPPSSPEQGGGAHDALVRQANVLQGWLTHHQPATSALPAPVTMVSANATAAVSAARLANCPVAEEVVTSVMALAATYSYSYSGRRPCTDPTASLKALGNKRKGKLPFPEQRPKESAQPGLILLVHKRLQVCDICREQGTPTNVMPQITVKSAMKGHMQLILNVTRGAELT